jgi:hypothetical protein
MGDDWHQNEVGFQSRAGPKKAREVQKKKCGKSKNKSSK